MRILDRLTGRSVEAKVDRYSEVYGEVLLGMHRDIESQKRMLDGYRREMQEMLQDARLMVSDIRKAHIPIAWARRTSVLAIVLSLLSIGLWVWTLAWPG